MVSRYLKMAAVGLLLVSSGAVQAHDWRGEWGHRPQRHSQHRLHEACEDGNRRACVKFGIELGERRERREAWRQTYPQYDRWGYPVYSTTPTQQLYPQYDRWGYPKH